MPRKKGSAGRPGGLDEARELVALVASLSEAGDALTAEAVSSRLGVSAERAEKLVALVLTASDAGASPAHMVQITFDDSRLLDALPWHELAVLEQDDERTVAETPFYGGQWLVRMVAACGGSAHVDDPGLAALVTDYARTQLDL